MSTSDVRWPSNGLQAEAAKLRGVTLSTAVDDLDKAINMLVAARNQIELGMSSLRRGAYTVALILTNIDYSS